MIVCSCNVFSDADVRRVAAEAGHRPSAVHRCLGCRPRCGTCLPTIATLLHQAAPDRDALCASCPLARAATEKTRDELATAA